MTTMQPTTAATAADDPTGGHPFPQLRRRGWVNLAGKWGFAYDDARTGIADGLPATGAKDRTITVPFPPESTLSGIGDTSYHPVVWYSRTISPGDLEAAGLGAQGDRLILHFGAVDYRAEVWVDGRRVGEHEGGHVPFALDVTEEMADGASHLVVVRAEDEPLDVAQPRGKQEWQPEPHGIWYSRTTGIWQTVWLEARPAVAVEEIAWTPSRACDAVDLEITASALLPEGTVIAAELAIDGRPLASGSVSVPACRTAHLTVDLREMVHGQHYEELLWSPEHPRLIDAVVTLRTPDGCEDSLRSYLGLRSVGVERRRFLLNDRPYYVRSVLEQGFWPDSHLAAPSDDDARAEVALIKELGFNAARIHQKVETPRFLYWADRLGLLIWGEIAAPYEFSTTSMTRLVAEWTAEVRRDRAHPCIVTWVPINESWGVQHIGNRPAQQAFSRAISDLTRALDPSRPVISNDGWEHTSSDIVSLHDYDPDDVAVAERYATTEAVNHLLEDFGPVGRKVMALGHAPCPEVPVMVTEFGGIRYVTDDGASSWGYTTASDPEDFEERLRRAFEPLHASPALAGFCYTQLTDTMQEANGLADARRRPKIGADRIRRIVVGTHPTE